MINIIAAASLNNVIGKDGAIPWHLPNDLKHFKEITLNHPVIMGRITFESILDSLGKPLPGRRNIILSRSKTFSEYEDVEVISSLEEIDKENEIFIIGGERIYSQTISFADRIYLTRVEEHIDGDTYFPEIDMSIWKLTSEEKHLKDDSNPYNYTFLIYDRRQ